MNAPASSASLNKAEQPPLPVFSPHCPEYERNMKIKMFFIFLLAVLFVYYRCFKKRLAKNWW
jgi:hypothetical protein